MWRTEQDVLKDLALLNDFGDPETTEPCKITYTKGRGIPINRGNGRPRPNTLIDPRTGEEIDLDEESQNINNLPPRGRGRGAALCSDYFLLRKQLRMARPLGSGDDLIEAYVRRNRSEETQSSPDSPIDNLFVNLDRYVSTEKPEEKPNSRVKAVRSSSSPNNALIEGLLKSKKNSVPGTDSEKEEAKSATKLKVSDKRNKDYDYDFPNVFKEKNATCRNNSNSDNSSIRENRKTATPSGSTCTSIRGSIRGGKFIKPRSLKSLKNISSELAEDLHHNLNLNTEEDYKKEEEGAGICAVDKETLEREEKYRKLGERMHKTKIMVDNRKVLPNYLAEREIQPLPEMSDFNLPFRDDFIYKKVNFPPLNKKSE